MVENVDKFIVVSKNVGFGVNFEEIVIYFFIEDL